MNQPFSVGASSKQLVQCLSNLRKSFAFVAKVHRTQRSIIDRPILNWKIRRNCQTFAILVRESESPTEYLGSVEGKMWKSVKPRTFCSKLCGSSITSIERRGSWPEYNVSARK